MATSSLLLAALGAGTLLAASCTSSVGSYHCEVSADCQSETQAGGTCETNGFCSFSDPSCGDTGQRFGKGAGELSNQCVDEELRDAGPDGNSGKADAAEIDAGAPDAMPVCTAAPVVIEEPGLSTYQLPADCTSVTIEVFGAGGGGAHRNEAHDSGAGGGAASAIQLGGDGNSTILLAAGGGGGGSSDDANAVILGGGGGAGGYAQAQFTLSAGTQLTVIVGGGGKSNISLPNGVGGHGGDPNGGDGGDHMPGSAASQPWGGGGGGGDNSKGGSSTFGGGGGSDEDADGGDTTYGGAGSGGINGVGDCGQSTFGGTCNGVAGGGGGFFAHASATMSTGSLGSAGLLEQGGSGSDVGVGTGGRGGLNADDGANGKVIITPGN